METISQGTVANLLFAAVLSSTLVATIVGLGLNWFKEYFQKKSEKEHEQYKYLYGSISYQLLAMRVLKINRMELLDEISKEPVGRDANEILSKYSVVKPLISKWNEHKDKLIEILETNAGYIKKEHLSMFEDLLDGVVKRDITQEGKSGHTTEIRISKMLDAIEALQNELLGTTN